MNLSESRYKKIIELLSGEKPGHLLDIGCSSGDFVAGFANYGWTCFGVEISDVKATECRAKDVTCVVADISLGLPYYNNFFDAIIAGEIIEHLIDTDGFLEEIKRVLKPNGCLILTTPNLVSLENRLRIIMGMYPMWMDYRLQGIGHVRYYTPKILIKQICEHGFLLEKLTGNFVPPLSQRIGDDIRWPWLSLSGRMFPKLAQGLIVLARKVP